MASSEVCAFYTRHIINSPGATNQLQRYRTVTCYRGFLHHRKGLLGYDQLCKWVLPRTTYFSSITPPPLLSRRYNITSGETRGGNARVKCMEQIQVFYPALPLLTQPLSTYHPSSRRHICFCGGTPSPVVPPTVAFKTPINALEY
jgi:hypothetical protein